MLEEQSVLKKQERQQLMRNTRSFVRFDTHMKAQYFLQEKNRDWEEMKGRAVVDYIAEDDETSNKVELEDGNII